MPHYPPSQKKSRVQYNLHVSGHAILQQSNAKLHIKSQIHDHGR